MSDTIRWNVTVTVDKYGQDGCLYDTVTKQGNMLVYGGASALLNFLIGNPASLNAFDNTNAHIGVGNGTTAVSPSQTDLQGASTVRQPMDATYPQHTDGTTSANTSCVFRSTFGPGSGTFAWEEWGIFNASTGGRMLNRKVTSFGTKGAGDTWVLTVTVSVS